MRAVAGVVLARVGLLGTALVIAALGTRPAPGDLASVAAAALVLAPPLAALGAGAWLLLPIWRRRARRPEDTGRAGGAALRSALRTSLGPAGALVLVVLAARLFGEDAFAVTGFFGICAYALVDPILNLRRTPWLAHAVLSATLFRALFFVIGTIGDLGEGAMVYLAPLMAYPALMVLSGLIAGGRALWRRSAKAAAPDR